MLHDPPPLGAPDNFLENVLISYFPEGLPGDDPAMRGRTRNFSDFVAVNLIFSNEGVFQGFERPLREGGRYNSGRNIPVNFSVVDDQGKPIEGVSANIAVALPYFGSWTICRMGRQRFAPPSARLRLFWRAIQRSIGTPVSHSSHFSYF